MFSKPQFIDCRIREKVSSLPDNAQQKRYLARVFGKLMQSEDGRVVGCLTKLPELLGEQRTQLAHSRISKVAELRSKIWSSFENKTPLTAIYSDLRKTNGSSFLGFIRNCERAGITPSEIFASFGTENIAQQLSAMRYASYHYFYVAVGLKNLKLSRLKTAKLLYAHYLKGLNTSGFNCSITLARTLHYICTSPNAIAFILKKLGFSASEVAFGLYSVPGHEHYYKLPERKMPIKSINHALISAGYALDEIKFEPGMIGKVVETKENIDYYAIISGLTPIQYATQVPLLMAEHIPNFTIASPYPCTPATSR